MNTRTINSNTLTDAGASFVGVSAGAFSSRIIADKTSNMLKNDKLRHGVLLALGLFGTAFIDGKDTSGKLAQGFCAGVAGTQGLALIKALMNPAQDGILAKGLGEPDPIVIYDSNYTPSYDLPTDNYSDYTAYLSQPTVENTEFSLV